MEIDEAFNDSLIKKFGDLIKKPEKFLEKNDSLFTDLKSLTKVLYDYTKSKETEKCGLETLDKLIIDGFDEEQVWAGVELQNKVRIPEFTESLERIRLKSELQNGGINLLSEEVIPLESDDIALDNEEEREVHDDDDDDDDIDGDFSVKKVHFEDEEDENDDMDEGEEDEEEEKEEEGKGEEDILKDPDFQNMSDSDGDDLPLFEDADEEDDNDDDDDEDEEREGESEADKKTKELDAATKEYMENAMKNIRDRTSEVDDEFFKLSEMETFLDVEDRKVTNEDDNDEEGIDYFEAYDDDQNLMYHDYFQSDSKKKVNIFEDDVDDNDDEIKDDKMKSRFEEQQARLKKKIEKLEEEAIKPKAWQMTGEIAGPDRPENSLLQEHLDYDSVAKKAPIITEKVSKTLEDLIKQRIKDKAWDDVERKVKPVKNPYEYKKQLVLDQEKSKLSLAQIYEQEYLKQQGELTKEKESVSVLDKDDLEIPIEVQEIQKNMKSLFMKLDALTHYHFTPRVPEAEIKIIRDAPAIEMEEVAPIGISEDTLLAPQEIADAPKGELIGDSEKTSTDRKRERRKKKRLQKIKAQRLEKTVQNSNPGLGNKYAKERALKTLKDAEKKGQNVKMIQDKEGSQKVKSSSAFFEKLQNEVQSRIGQQKTKMDVKKKTKSKSSSQLKL